MAWVHHAVRLRRAQHFVPTGLLCGLQKKVDLLLKYELLAHAAQGLEVLFAKNPKERLLQKAERF